MSSVVGSFTRSVLNAFAERAGLSVVASRISEGPLLGFQMLLLKRTMQPRATFKLQSYLMQNRARSFYQIEKIVAGRAYAILGVEKICDLLAAYCPGMVDRGQAFVIDTPSQETYLGKLMISQKVFL